MTDEEKRFKKAYMEKAECEAELEVFRLLFQKASTEFSSLAFLSYFLGDHAENSFDENTKKCHDKWSKDAKGKAKKQKAIADDFEMQIRDKEHRLDFLTRKCQEAKEAFTQKQFGPFGRCLHTDCCPRPQ